MAVQARRRLRVVTAIGCIGIASLVSCGPDAAPVDPSEGLAGGSPTKPSASQTTNAQGPPPGARNVDQKSMAADKLVAAILNECHPSLGQRMSQVKVAVTLPNKRRLLVQADLPDRAVVAEVAVQLRVLGALADAQRRAAPVAEDDGVG